MLILRVALGALLLRFGAEKFSTPGNAPVGFVFGNFYRNAAYAAGKMQQFFNAIAAKSLMEPWTDPFNHFSLAAIYMAIALLAFVMLRANQR